MTRSESASRSCKMRCAANPAPHHRRVLVAPPPPVGAGNAAVVVGLPRWGPMLSPRVPNLVPIPGPRMERETPGQRPRPNYGHPHPSPPTLQTSQMGTSKSLERPAVVDSSTSTEMPPDQPRHSFRHPQALELIDAEGNITPFGSFSGGEKVLAVLAARLVYVAAATNVSTMWIDEPLEHLDLRNRQRCARLLATVAANDPRLSQIVVTTYEAEIADVVASRHKNVSVIPITSTAVY